MGAEVRILWLSRLAWLSSGPGCSKLRASREDTPPTADGQQKGRARSPLQGPQGEEKDETASERRRGLAVSQLFLSVLSAKGVPYAHPVTVMPCVHQI